MDVVGSLRVGGRHGALSATERDRDFIAAIFDVSQATVSRRRTALEALIAAALADLKPVPAEVTGGDTGVGRRDPDPDQ
ncbi:hypothetical protein [uncultured Amnibacterium sp.]|uniref:hypothetical protein n=1 Tax=uncultured Amnibacterium sp. TaxID=1631851 RepID=UPI0035CBDC26